MFFVRRHSYTRYAKCMQKTTGFGMMDCLSLLRLGGKYFKSLREEDRAIIYMYNDKYMRYFVRQSTKRGRVCAYNQNYHSKSCDNFLKCLAEEIIIDFESSSTYNIIETYIKHSDQHNDIFKKENNNHFQDYRDILFLVRKQIYK